MFYFNREAHKLGWLQNVEYFVNMYVDTCVVLQAAVTWNLDVLKEPRGFIKLLQFVSILNTGDFFPARIIFYLSIHPNDS